MDGNRSLDSSWSSGFGLFRYGYAVPPDSFQDCPSKRSFDDVVGLPYESFQHQSSKQDSKRKRKENASTTSGKPNSYAASNEVILKEEIESHDIPTNSKSSSKKTRGPTRCPDVPMGNHLRQELEFNEGRQPIGPSSISLSSYMGRIAREKISIKYDDWRHVPDVDKECCWEAIRQKFDWKGFGMEEDARIFAISWLGRLWRAYKSRLATGLDNKRNHIESDTWEIFINKRLCKAYVEKSKQFKERRAKQKDVPYTGSREGYARVEDRMKKASSDPSSIKRRDVWFKAHTKKNGEPSSSGVAKLMETYEAHKGSQTSQSSTSIEDDAISVMFGPERSGRVRGLGRVVTSSKVDALTKKFAGESKLEGEIASLKQMMERQGDHMKQMMERHAEMISHLSHKLNERENGKNKDFTMHRANSSQSQRVTSSNRSRTCTLFNCFGANEEVAIGILATDDPSTAVHFAALGEGDVCVRVRAVMKPKCPLWKPTWKLKVLEDAIGSLIEWPEKYIILTDN